jgi:arabinose-5-phosphate isomerase
MYLQDIVEQVISKEIAGLQELRRQLDLVALDSLVEKIASTTGKIIITGIGKSGIIAKKIVASLCSIGIGSVFLNPADAAHGDMGIIARNDLVLILSNSGQGRELKRIIFYCNVLKIYIVGLSRDRTSYLIKHSNIGIVLPNTPEVSDLAIPTTSSTMMIVFGDVLTIALKEKIHLKGEQYSLYHPGGKIGLMYRRVKDLMIKGDALPIVEYNSPLIDIMIVIALKKLGFAIVLDEQGMVSGIAKPEIAERLNGMDIVPSNLIKNTYKIISGEETISDALVELNQYNQLIVVVNKEVKGVFTMDILNSIIK